MLPPSMVEILTLSIFVWKLSLIQISHGRRRMKAKFDDLLVEVIYLL
jgi:hypothetical protein